MTIRIVNGVAICCDGERATFPGRSRCLNNCGVNIQRAHIGHAGDDVEGRRGRVFIRRCGLVLGYRINVRNDNGLGSSHGSRVIIGDGHSDRAGIARRGVSRRNAIVKILVRHTEADRSRRRINTRNGEHGIVRGRIDGSAGQFDRGCSINSCHRKNRRDIKGRSRGIVRIPPINDHLMAIQESDVSNASGQGRRAVLIDAGYRVKDQAGSGIVDGDLSRVYCRCVAVVIQRRDLFIAQRTSHDKCFVDQPVEIAVTSPISPASQMDVVGCRPVEGSHRRNSLSDFLPVEENGLAVVTPIETIGHLIPLPRGQRRAGAEIIAKKSHMRIPIPDH